MPLSVALAVAASMSGTVLTVDLDSVIGPISPFIYGSNQPDWARMGSAVTFMRLGGNRWSAYNWETNASNAGTDWFNQNDSYLGGGETPGKAVRQHVDQAFARGAAALVTVPMTGHVSADKNGGGDVNQTANYLDVRFHPSYAKKGSALRASPLKTDHAVYQDEFVYHMKKKYLGVSNPLWFSLDNEPDLWHETHPRITLSKPTYADFLERSKLYAEGIKKVMPNALVFGPASYGWSGYQNFQNAPDHGNRFFLDFYLQQFQQHDLTAGKRHLDVLDLHWYPEARGGGKRITEDGTEAGLYQARMQAPRSLWDPAYTEDSWIAQWMTSGPIRLVPRMQEKIDSNYPGTKLAITEWNYGGGNHISGAIAVADVLGIFGKYGVFAASYWNLKADESYAYGAFNAFRDFDRGGSNFGDLALETQNPDVQSLSIYASKSTTDPNTVTLVVINKASVTREVAIELGSSPTTVRAFRMKAGTKRPSTSPAPILTATGFTQKLPATSITTYRCTL